MLFRSGASLIRIATYRDLLENDYSRKIVGFDAFGEFPTENLCSEEDLNFVKEFETVSGDGLSDDELAKVLAEKGIQNLDLVKGNVFDSLPKYLHENPAEQEDPDGASATIACHVGGEYHTTRAAVPQ